MNADLSHHLVNDRPGAQGRRLTAGVVIGIVTNNKDAEGLGPVKVRFPWLDELNESFWARIAAPMAGPNRGAYFLPEKDEDVLGMFEHGDVRLPYIIGGLWNGKDGTPADNSDGENNLRVIKSRSGHVIKPNNKQGSETVEIIDGSGNNMIVIDTNTNSITISAGGDINLSAPRGTITFAGSVVNIQASDTSTLAAVSSMTVPASGTMAVVGNPVNIN